VAGDLTQTMTPNLLGGEAAPSVALVVAWHNNPALIGARIVVQHGERLTLGRELDRPVASVLDDPRISRRHVEVALGDGGLRVRELGSRNGTVLQGVPLLQEHGAVLLSDGDVLWLGDVLLVARPGVGARRVPSLAHVWMVGPAMEAVIEQVHLVGPHSTTVLVSGESGVGKELVAAALHEASGRGGKLVAVNCGGLAESLLQSELFGHHRGAFTGAQQHRAGLVMQARDGTLFLDEIGEASPALQAALLRLLQEGEVRAVGSDRTESVDVRVVAATHRDLGTLVAEGRFRQDLYERLRTWHIRVPPLRERIEDVPDLAQRLIAAHLGRQVRLPTALVRRLVAARWPGNVRQLAAFAERLCIANADAVELRVPSWLFDELDEERPAAHTPPQHPAAPVARPSREVLQSVLRKHHGNVVAAASALGVSRRTLYRWMEALEVDPDEAR
jgi:DNA-binding NtrC family response regulator